MASAPTYQEGESAQHRFDPNFTDAVINAIGPKVDDRTRFVMGKLIRHLHDFIREVELTNDEWFEGVRFVNSIGKTTTASRNEAHRISDVLGVESLVDEIAHKHINESGEAPTSSTILGPFWSPHSPFRELGESIITDPHPDGQVTLMHGVVRDLDTKKGIPNAVIDIWQASANGKYDFQDQENQKPNNLRGKFTTNENGEYWYYCYKPTAYSLPMDGAAGQLFKTLDRHPFRPAHIHLMVTAEGFKPLITQLYPRDDQWVQNDTVFAVKDDLLLDFEPAKDDKSKFDLTYNVTLAPTGSKTGRLEGIPRLPNVALYINPRPPFACPHVSSPQTPHSKVKPQLIPQTNPPRPLNNPTPLTLITANALKKGDVLGVSRVAGIMAAKKCPEIVPLCHPIALSHVGVELRVFGSAEGAAVEGAGADAALSGKDDMAHGGVQIEVKVACTGATGVEMEALTGVMGAALSVVDMCKAVDKFQRVGDVRVVLKEGGRVGCGGRRGGGRGRCEGGAWMVGELCRCMGGV
ncbi:hypothetical protein OPT61_g2386 [Boeremia exigua]|uniref:Uncharacterized protein n=1 Tax=Boeremia exigua TaxID=749465 RepID=A0ACC2ILP7_9PLEO|nr:hypothetical protein OPT61_g2386 [Boeremia exigua]